MKVQRPNQNKNHSIRLLRNVMTAVAVVLVVFTLIATVFAAQSSFLPSAVGIDSYISQDSSDADFYTKAESSTTDTVSYATATTTAASIVTTVGSILPTDTTNPATVPTEKETTASTTPKKSPSNDNLPDLSGYVVVLDPGHQKEANNDQEPVSPGSDETKAKCSSGTTGVSTGRAEYDVNLEISLKIRDYLTSCGCDVYMTRTSNDVDISNIERAQYALSKNPDVYIRIHCNAAENSDTHGISVFVADTGKYKADLPGWGESLGRAVSEATGSPYLYCDASSVYSGLNWATDIPSFLLELGFMTNPKEDDLLSDPDYQSDICRGIAAFVAEM